MEGLEMIADVIETFEPWKVTEDPAQLKLDLQFEGEKPYRDLRPGRGFWSPGEFLHSCSTCKRQFLGGVSALACAPCAYSDPWRSRKDDKRPKNGMWAPGEYLDYCRKCRCGFVGDKRAMICAPCAYGDKR